MIMSGDIYLVAPGGRAGDIYLTNPSVSLSSATRCSDPPTSLTCYMIRGRVVATDGTPRDGLAITLFERRSLTVDVVVATTTTDTLGVYTIQFALPPSSSWDVFVRAEDEDEDESVDSVLLSDLEEGSYTVDLVLGEGPYAGSSEWERIEAKVTPLLGATNPKDVPDDRIEWLSKRADVFPLRLAAYVQAHRLANARSVKPESCYAFLRAGLPSALVGLLRAGEAAWKSALRTSWTEEILPLPGTGSTEDQDAEVTDEIAAMRELLVDAAVTAPIEGVNHRVIFDAAGLSVEQQRAYATLWLNHSGTLTEFWTEVSGSSLSAEVPLLQFSVQAGIVARGHLDTIEALLAELGGSITTIADTAEWSVSDWNDVLVARSVTPPEEIAGDNLTEKRQNYARVLFNIVEDTHPTLSLRHSIAREITPPPSTEFLVTFFTNNPNFDIGQSTIGVYLHDASSPWTGIDLGDQPEARQNLERVQRIYRLTPRIGRYATTKVLLDNGIVSASQVVKQTKNEFVNQFGPLLSDDDHHADDLAAAIWHTATKIHTMTIGVASQFALAKNNTNWLPLGYMSDTPFEGDENGLVELSTILGNLDYCACEQCRSVFSAAAYLTDLLKFLDDRGALATLLARRPDIAHILLDCDNTNTILPYIDLVNELLEAYVLGSGTLPDGSNQTTWQAKELRLHPEHVEIDVYEPQDPPETNLSTLIHPWTLPFSLPTVEAQTYLRHLGVPRHELMRAFAEATPDVAYQNGMAADVLGMSKVEFDIVAGAYTVPSGDGREFWGFPTEQNNWYDILNGNHGVEGSDIGELLVRASLTIDQLTELLELDYIDPDGDLAITWDETCALEDARINTLAAVDLDRMHRFIRLQRNSGIPARMLNVLINDALGGTLDAASLRALADIMLLEQRFRLGWDVIATWWASAIDPRSYTTGERSLYWRRFLAKDLGDSHLFEPAGDLTQLQDEEPEKPILDTHLPRILAGLGIKDVDYQAIIASGFITPTEEPADPGPRFSFANLTMMFKIATLARSLKLSIPDFIRLADNGGLIGSDPFADPAATTHFVALVDGIRASGLSINELDWLLRHEYVGVDPLDSEAIGRALVDLARGLNTIEAETALLVDPEGLALPGNLAEILVGDTAEADIATTRAIVNRTTPLLQGERESFIDAKFVRILDLTEAKAILADWVTEPQYDIAQRRAWLIGKIVGHLRRRALVYDTLASNFAIPADVGKMLITEVLTDPSDVTEPYAPLFEVFRLPFADEAAIAEGIDAESHSNMFAAWTRLAKASLFCKRFQMRADEVKWYRYETWLSLNELPLDSGDSDASFTEWEALRQALDLRDLSRPKEIAFEQVDAAGSFTAAMQVLADHAGWDAVALEAVSTAIGYDDKADLVREVAPTRLRRIVEIGDRLGVSSVDVLAWVTSDTAGTPTMAHATAIKLAARSKYGEDRWPEVATPLRDAIRERQRDALVHATISITEDFSTSNDVFAHLLIDVEMSHCMMTSRIKQAIASVQIFVHRVLLHLESVTFDSEAIARWEWMKNYRVWEANRKVFLYPENWIEPELRSNKSPQFKDLESALTQGILEESLVRRVMGGYLDQLERVSNLEIVGVYRHSAQASDDLSLWLLARTQSDPRTWFITQRRSTGEWQAWEEIPHQFDGNNVALVISEQRVHLFSLTTIDAPTLTPQGQPDPNQPAGFRLTLGHIERAEDGWSAISLSTQSDVFSEPRDALRLQVSNTDDTFLDLYVCQYPPDDGSDTRMLCQFRYRPAHRHVAYVTNFSSWEPPIDTVALQSSWRFEGQRHVKSSLHGTNYYLPPFDKELFYNAPDDEYRALVYQADTWLGNGEFPNASAAIWTSRTPVIYDDRRRKYLLEIAPPEGEQDEPPAEVPGKQAKDSFHVCTEASGGTPPAKTVDEGPELQRRDNVIEYIPWNGGIPGYDDGGAQVVDPVALLEKVFSILEGDPEPEGEENPPSLKLDVEPLYHPYARQMISALAERGLDGLYPSEDSSPLFRQNDNFVALGVDGLLINPWLLHSDAPREEYDFRFDSLYGVYNWEIFYHTPMLIASKLTQEQRFDEAQKWHHRIFNPIDIVDEETSSKYWRMKKFVDEAEALAVNQFQAMLGIGVNGAEKAVAVKQFTEQVEAWARAPFDPHAVARVRPGVYQRALLRKYFDNLIAWADNLFRRDTIESITEATVLYIVVSELLGRPPYKTAAPETEAKSYTQLDEEGDGLDAFANALVQLESWITLPASPAEQKGCVPVTRDPWVRVPIVSRFWYFCYPPNPELLKYWDIIADRLFKIRHCQNIEGVERQLPLFEPPIDPALLVQAAAAGVDIRSVLGELDSGLPPYRFRSVHARAMAFTNSVRNLGSMLLSAYEKRDAEELARLRVTQEVALLEEGRELLQLRIDEASESIRSLQTAKEAAVQRINHYDVLLQGEGGLLQGEDTAKAKEDLSFDYSEQAKSLRQTAQERQLTGTILAAIPTLSVGFPPVSISFGGQDLANVSYGRAGISTFKASNRDYSANKASIEASYERRKQDWKLQLGQAFRESDRTDHDIAAANVRLAIAKRELAQHDRQTEQSREVDAYMRSKFTNLELYSWMIDQLTSLYFQSYQLAFDVAKRAERAYRYELAILDSEPPIIKYGYWDSLTKGLLAGDKLGHDLERLDLAYMDRDEREYELRKSVSLAQLSPAALQLLREEGTSSFSLPEVLFNLDHPGHYLRRIRGIRLTIPAVVGPYTTLGATLVLGLHETQQRKQDEPESYIERNGAGQAIATSTAMQDGGVFNLDFKDERYLPFEYAGVISNWTLRLPQVVRQFDYRTIEDVVIHVDYTAREGGSTLRGNREVNLRTAINAALEGQPLVQLVMVHEAFPNEWEQFFAVNGSDNHELSLPLTIDHFPYFAKQNEYGITVSHVTCKLLLGATVESAVEFDGSLSIAASPVSFDQDDRVVSATFEDVTPAVPATMTLTIAHADVDALYDGDDDLDPTKAVGMAMIIRYTLTTPP
jgi:hypothetical protein